MATTMDTLSHKAQRAAFGVALDMALKHIEKDTSKGLLDVLDISQKFMGDTFKKKPLKRSTPISATRKTNGCSLWTATCTACTPT